MVKSDLLNNLEQVIDWKEKRVEALNTQIDSSEQLEERLGAELKMLQQRLEQAQIQRKEALEEQSRMVEEEKEHFRIGISKGLEEGTKLIDERNIIYSNLKKARINQVEQLLKQPKFQEKITEYEEFQKNQNEFSRLPKSYQAAIRKHHEQVEKDLTPIFRALSEQLPPAKESKCIFGVVAAIDPSFDKPEAMAVVIPVSFSTYTDPSTEDEDLHQVIAYRICAAISGALHRIGVSNASIHYGDYNGFLSIQVWLEGQNLSGDIKQAIAFELERIRTRSSELKAAQLGVDISWVESEMLAGG